MGKKLLRFALFIIYAVKISDGKGIKAKRLRIR